MNRSPSVNGTVSRISPAIVPTYQRALRSPPQHLLNSERADSVASTNGANAPIPRPKSPSECWLQAFKTGKADGHIVVLFTILCQVYLKSVFF